MIRFTYRLLLAATLSVALGSGARAAERVGLAGGLTAGGLNISPRTLGHDFDADLSVLGGTVNFPTSGGNMHGFQTALQARLSDRLVLHGTFGSLTTLGLRGPLWDQGGLVLGWDAHFRSESYFELPPGYGLSGALFGMPGSTAAGGEGALNAMLAWNGLDLYASPLLGVMSNRSFLGLAAGVDWPLDRWVLGYATQIGYNALTPGGTYAPIPSTESQHRLGLRYEFDERTFLLGNYTYTPADSYGIPRQAFLVGAGMRLAGHSAAPVPPAPKPEVHHLVLEGRLFNSLAKDGNLPGPMTLGLKHRVGKTFVNVPPTVQTDAAGNYVFRDFGEAGDYQVVFRNVASLPNIVGVLVSDAVTVAGDQPVGISMDVAWDDAAFKETLEKTTQSVFWGPKPGFDGATYQGILREDPNDSRTDVLPFPAEPTVDSKGSFDVSAQIKGRKLYQFIKFWKKGGEFNGATFYGQSRVRTLEFR